MKALWAVEIDGEYEEGLSFRAAFNAFSDADSGRGIEANAYPIRADHPPAWFTAYGSQDMWTGRYPVSSLHIPRHVTPSSRMRLARLLGLATR
jgi:hypothetical protein